MVVPPELSADERTVYKETVSTLLESYSEVQRLMASHLESQLPKPDEMKPEAYRRNLAARAFDVAR